MVGKLLSGQNYDKAMLCVNGRSLAHSTSLVNCALEVKYAARDVKF